MPTRLRVNGFKNLINVDLHFGPFTCIAGANAVGKSNLFDVILFLGSLMDAPIMDAAMAVRKEGGSVSDIRHLFTRMEKGIYLPIEIEAEMLVPPAGSDDLDQPAEAKTTFLVYRLELQYQPPEGAVSRPQIELIDQVGRVEIDRDDKRKLSTLVLTDRYGTELPVKALSDGTLRFLALASIEIDPTLIGLICIEEPENGIHPERVGAMLRLLRDIVVDPELPIGDDNPLRQVIINTHSPVVVVQVPDDTLIFVVPEQRVVKGRIIKGVSFSSLSKTWRAEARPRYVIAKGKALAFLQPVAEQGNPKRKGADQRVIDREDIVQLNLVCNCSHGSNPVHITHGRQLGRHLDLPAHLDAPTAL